MPLSAAQQSYLHELARALAAAPASGGERAALVARAAETLGRCPKTVYALLNRHTGWRSGRKTRADKGETCVTPELAMLAGGLVHLSRRQGANASPPSPRPASGLRPTAWAFSTPKRAR